MRQAGQQANMVLSSKRDRKMRQGSWMTGAATAIWLVLQSTLGSPPGLAQSPAAKDALTYSDLLRKVEAGEVNRIQIDPARNVAEVQLKSPIRATPARK
jgi:cell division protease FtsH